MDIKQTASLGEVISEIRRLCEKKAGGMLFYNGDNGHLAQIGVTGGRIASLSCLKKQGMDAVPLIRQIQTGWFRFAAMEIPDKSSLPSTADILAALGEKSASPAVGSTGSIVLNQKQVEIVQNILAEYIGPIALLFCGQLNGASLESALDTLAKEIANPQHAKQFREKVKQSLR